MNLAEKLKTVFGRVENIVGKGENVGYQHFLLFPQYFQKRSKASKVGIVWERVEKVDQIVKKDKNDLGNSLYLVLHNYEPVFSSMFRFLAHKSTSMSVVIQNLSNYHDDAVPLYLAFYGYNII